MNKIDWDNLDYRQGTVAFVLNKENKILLVQKNIFKDNEWDGPGGGVDEGETTDETIIRELGEELGSDKFEIIKCSQILDKYIWPKEIIEKRFLEHRKTYKGQIRKQYLVKFTGKDDEIKIQESELRKFLWVEVKHLKEYLVFPGYFEKVKKVLEEFGIKE